MRLIKAHIIWFYVCTMLHPAFGQTRIHPTSIDSIKLFWQMDSLNTLYDTGDVPTNSGTTVKVFGSCLTATNTFDAGGPVGAEPRFQESQADLGNHSYIYNNGKSTGGSVACNPSDITCYNFLHQDDMSIVIVFRSRRDTSVTQYLMTNRAGAASIRGVDISKLNEGTFNNILQFTIGNGTGNIVVLRSKTSVDSSADFHTLIITFDDSIAGDDVTLYLDSGTVPDTTEDITAAVSSGAATQELWFFREPGGTPFFPFKGDLALVAFYSDALTTTQVDGIYNWIQCEFELDTSLCATTTHRNVRRPGLHR